MVFSCVLHLTSRKIHLSREPALYEPIQGLIMCPSDSREFQVVFYILRVEGLIAPSRISQKGALKG